LFEDFRKAAIEASKDLGIYEKKVSFTSGESKLGFDYLADAYEGTKGFDFHLRNTIDQESSKEELEAFLSIHYAEGVAPYHFHENIDYIKGHPDFLERWVSWAIFNYRQEHEKVNLESLFHDVDIQTLGIPGYCDPAQGEAELLFHGLHSAHREKVLIYRFRHMSGKEGYLMRSISYAIFLSPRAGTPLWIVFPNNCGLDSGRARYTYRFFEQMIRGISEKLEVEVKEFDVKYDELDTFLLKNEAGLHSVLRKGQLVPLYRWYDAGEILEGSEMQFEEFTSRLERKLYPQALRDLRALVQQAQENLARLKGVDISGISNPSVHNLATLLIENRQIDGRLLSWFDAFASIANLASHGDFPSIDDMQDSITHDRVLLAFYLGRHLLDELDSHVQPKIFSNGSPKVPWGRNDNQTTA